MRRSCPNCPAVKCVQILQTVDSKLLSGVQEAWGSWNCRGRLSAPLREATRGVGGFLSKVLPPSALSFLYSLPALLQPLWNWGYLGTAAQAQVGW